MSDMYFFFFFFTFLANKSLPITRGLFVLLINDTENSGQCFCGETMPTQGKAASDDECNLPCKGDASQTCGGKEKLSVYLNTNPP
jgi:hypothetical protein